MNSVELKQNAENIGIDLNEEMLEKLDIYCQLLQEWNKKMNLTAIVETEDIYEKHFYDSILPLQYINKGKLIDVGTGAGFPGIVFKIVREDLDITLLEPIKKRCIFLEEVINQLNLKNIEVVNARAEDYVQKKRESYDYACARAVANLNILSELCIPFIKVGGIFLAMKGNKAEEEHRDAIGAIQLLGCDLHTKQSTTLSNEDIRINLFYKKEKETPNKYPRNYGAIKKKPLK